MSRLFDPAHPGFDCLPRYLQARTYYSRGWTIEALMDEYDVARRTVQTWLRPNGMDSWRQSSARARAKRRAAA